MSLRRGRQVFDLPYEEMQQPVSTRTIAWDYVILTASNARQAAAYEAQLELRRALGLLSGTRHVLVVADPPGRRIGSGGSTLLCIMEVLHRELGAGACDPAKWQETLNSLRILIVHGGGDSRRLPAYGACGKVFVPMPGETDSAIPLTLLDRQLPTYMALPPAANDAGQIVITSGDVLLLFDPAAIRWHAGGLTGLGCFASPEQASRHGVFCAGPDGNVRMFLQKPSPDEQAQRGAIGSYGQTILDIGIMQFDASAAVAMLRMCDVGPGADGRLAWAGPIGRAIDTQGMNFYCEVCCAMGRDASPEQHLHNARVGGSTWSTELLRRVFDAVASVPFHVDHVPHCAFLDFGASRQIIASGVDLSRMNRGIRQAETCLEIQNHVADSGVIAGIQSWVEGCRVAAPLTLEGDNVVVGVDVNEPLTLVRRACLDVMPGRNRDGKPVQFVRCYGIDDSFKGGVADGATFNGMPLRGWLDAVGAADEDVWPPAAGDSDRSIWTARLFPAELDDGAYRRWLWMHDAAHASAGDRRRWLAADRYSLAEIAEFADHAAFTGRRYRFRAEEIRRSLPKMFDVLSDFSAPELAHALAHVDDPAGMLVDLLAEAHSRAGDDGSGLRTLAVPRVVHSVGNAIDRTIRCGSPAASAALGALAKRLSPAVRDWLVALGLDPAAGDDAAEWPARARAAAFEYLGRTIVSSRERLAEPPRSSLRADEIVWGRAPARLDLGGGWTDTPPYALEHGGCVINAAVNLNGQPPIHCYARVIHEPVLRISSIDIGTRLEISDLASLLDYRSATSEFGLVKAALALSGLSPETGVWPDGITLKGMLEHFGGGIELTTLAAVPKGSGLGTSSIMGAVILAVIQRVMGRSMTSQELFHGVLRLEQTLTTGGGWQDQIGGVVGDVKVITTEPGLIPDARIHFVPSDLLDPRANGGQTLLYYTGITRLAKNILQQVVGRYLDRDRAAMATLRQLYHQPSLIADALSRKHMPSFGRLIDVAWRLNKQLDPDSSNAAIENLLAGVRSHLFGAKLLGAGGGGFLLMVCRSPEDAVAVRRKLEADPPNARARFFDFDIGRAGLEVTVC